MEAKSLVYLQISAFIISFSTWGVLKELLEVKYAPCGS
jgi:hypothetical protein